MPLHTRRTIQNTAISVLVGAVVVLSVISSLHSHKRVLTPGLAILALSGTLFALAVLRAWFGQTAWSREIRFQTTSETHTFDIVLERPVHVRKVVFVFARSTGLYLGEIFIEIGDSRHRVCSLPERKGPDLLRSPMEVVFRWSDLPNPITKLKIGFHLQSNPRRERLTKWLGRGDDCLVDIVVKGTP